MNLKTNIELNLRKIELPVGSTSVFGTAVTMFPSRVPENIRGFMKESTTLVARFSKILSEPYSPQRSQ